jgi:hypothetical protein
VGRLDKPNDADDEDVDVDPQRNNRRAATNRIAITANTSTDFVVTLFTALSTQLTAVQKCPQRKRAFLKSYRNQFMYYKYLWKEDLCAKQVDDCFSRHDEVLVIT